MTLLHLHKARLDLSSIQPGGRCARTHNGGAAIDHQGRKAARTTNLLLPADKTGPPLACASPQAGNHHNLFATETSFGELCALV
ncbi:hypothetical protein [Hymenobacter nivis]|uniref:Uncharacterized protein n=1 Tax=Hymenobacter nivis TaxID=1850093 RepID=A0A2Z3GL77_9BACT|nr:hypothetical protein [Hymenobacter nivis]AWM31906.1 hypothetical protein DDQ68_03335 [Hymenobacter nivis]